MKKFKKRKERAKISALKTVSYGILFASKTLDAFKFWWVSIMSGFNRCPVCGRRKHLAEVKDAKGHTVGSLVYCSKCEQHMLEAFKSENTNWLGKEIPQA
jgi:hypothetical protein